MTTVLRNITIALIFFSLSATLFSLLYSGLEDGYGYVRDDYTSQNPAEIFESMSIIDNISSATSQINLSATPSSGVSVVTDLVGGLISIGVGFLNIIWGVITFPKVIMSIASVYLGIPKEVVNAVGLIITVVFIFTIISIYVGRDT